MICVKINDWPILYLHLFVIACILYPWAAAHAIDIKTTWIRFVTRWIDCVPYRCVKNNYIPMKDFINVWRNVCQKQEASAGTRSTSHKYICATSRYWIQVHVITVPQCLKGEIIPPVLDTSFWYITLHIVAKYGAGLLKYIEHPILWTSDKWLSPV